MYATVLEALELSPGLSFLNVGSGSGYLSCLAACLLGECGLSHGIELNPSTVKHSEECCSRWFDNIVRRREDGEDVPIVSTEGVSIVQGNCFSIDLDASVETCRYDRIYIGAGCPESRKEFFFTLLADDGIMVASINEKNEMIKIVRRHRNIFSETRISQVIFAPLIEPAEEVNEMTPLGPRLSISSITTDMEPTLSSSPASTISFASTPPTSSWVFPPQPNSSRSRSNTVTSMDSKISGNSSKKVRLPPVLWAPTLSRHRQYPKAFKEAVMTLLAAARREPTPAMILPNQTKIGASVCGKLPHHLWTYIITFTAR